MKNLHFDCSYMIEKTFTDLTKEFTYEDLQKMKYLDQVICETLRFHNLVGALQRVANEDYKIPGHDLVIKKGTKVWINIIGIHMDPKHYNNPEVFDPENFNEDSKANRNK